METIKRELQEYKKEIAIGIFAGIALLCTGYAMCIFIAYTQGYFL